MKFDINKVKKLNYEEIEASRLQISFPHSWPHSADDCDDDHEYSLKSYWHCCWKIPPRCYTWNRNSGGCLYCYWILLIWHCRHRNDHSHCCSRCKVKNIWKKVNFFLEKKTKFFFMWIISPNHASSSFYFR